MTATTHSDPTDRTAAANPGGAAAADRDRGAA
jgi:hypothetical protein